MFRIFAYNQFLNLKNSIKIYYLLIVGVFVSVVIYMLNQNLLGTLTVLICTGILFFLFSQKPRKILIEMDTQTIKIDQKTLAWSNCVSWALVDLGGVLEFVLYTSQLEQKFLYFYMEEEADGVKNFIIEIAKYLPYQENITQQNRIHSFLRSAGFR